MKWHKYIGVVLLALAFSGCGGRAAVGELNLEDRVVVIVQSDMSDDAKNEAIRSVIERERDAGANWKSVILDPSIIGIIVGIALK